MTQMTSSADKVALVQTAAMLPIVLMSTPAGAIADMFDRRLVGIVALSIAFAGAIVLSVLTYLGLLMPSVLLAFCFIIGTGMALFGPSWQASVAEQVPAEMLPSAVSLNGISFNLARSFGPAIGGLIVAFAGAYAAFATNALLYIPLLVVLFLWRRVVTPPRLPPERLGRAIVSGVRYIMHSPAIRVVLGRTLLTGLAGGSLSALMPLIARDLLGGGPSTYGIILGAFGMGAVVGALSVSVVRARLGGEWSVRASAILMAVAIAGAALSRSVSLTAAALVAGGAAWMIAITLFNIGVQLSAPRWVAGRALAGFQAAISGGVALGGWGWGHVTELVGLDKALLLSSAAMLASALLGVWLRMPRVGGRNEEAIEMLADPEVNLRLTDRSGPIIIEIEYRVEPARAREFYDLMQKMQLIRQRNGAYGWSIARDITDPALWTERYHCPTWLDFLRQRNRLTQAERALQLNAMQFHSGPDGVRIRRMLERPFGSVRWKDETPDKPGADALISASPGAGT